MTYSDWQWSILAGASPTQRGDTRARRALAAAATVLAQRGPEWCRERASRFRSEVKRILKLAVGVMAFLFGGWWVVLSWVLPLVFAWLDRHVSPAGVVAGVDFRAMADDASAVLRG